MKLQFIPEEVAWLVGWSKTQSVQAIAVEQSAYAPETFLLRLTGPRGGVLAALELSAADFWKLGQQMQRASASQAVLAHPEKPL